MPSLQIYFDEEEDRIIRRHQSVLNVSKASVIKKLVRDSEKKKYAL